MLKRFVVASLVAGLALSAQSALARVDVTAIPQGGDDPVSPFMTYARDSQPAETITAIPPSQEKADPVFSAPLPEKRVDERGGAYESPFPFSSGD